MERGSALFFFLTLSFLKLTSFISIGHWWYFVFFNCISVLRGKVPNQYYTKKWIQFSSVAQLCPTLCDPMNRSTPGLPVHHQLPEFTQTPSITQSIESVMPSSHLILSRPLLLLPPIPPSIRVFSDESTLRMRWSKYWSFSLSISPSNEHPGLISF